MAGNSSRFNIRTIIGKQFPIILSSFDVAFTLKMYITQRFNIDFISSAIARTTSNINLKGVRTIVSNAQLIGRQIQDIKLKSKLSFVIREIGRLVFSTNIKTRLTFFARDRQRTTSNITLKKIKMSFTAIYGTFYTLGVYDPQTLGTLDPQTLGTLDFTAIP